MNEKVYQHKRGIIEKRIMKAFFLFLGLILASLFFISIGQTAPSDYPTRPIEVVVHTTPGGTVDTTIRLVNPKVSEILGVPLIVINKAAGSGAAGIESVIKAKPDGYTILGGADTAIVPLPLFNPEISFTFKNLIPIAWCTLAPNVIVVPSSSPFKSLQELLDFAKKNPGKLTYGSTGAVHISRISMELIKKSAGVDIVHVPYQGGGPLTSAILGGHVDLANFFSGAAIPQIKAEKLRALAICAEKRSDEIPQVPTTFELGYSKATLPVRVGYLAPVGTPQPIIDKWTQAIQKALADPTLGSQIKNASLTLDFKPRDAMTKTMEELNQILSEWIKEEGLKK